MQKDKITFNKVIQNKQKAIIIGLFAISIILLIYSLMFMTPFYDAYCIDNSASLLKTKTSTYGIDFETYKTNYPDAIDYVITFGMQVERGLKVGYFTTVLREGMQVFNKALFLIAFFGIVGSLILFVYHSPKRKRYYLTNFISIGIVIAFDLFASIFTLLNVIKYMSYFANEFNYEIVNAYQSSVNNAAAYTEYYSFATFSWIFIVGIILCAICIAIAVAGIVFLVRKYLYQKKHPALDISGVVINE